MFQGLRTIIYPVSDLEKAKAWYGRVLKSKPYFDKPFYVGFNVSGYELGLDPDLEGAPPGGSMVAYWEVADARSALSRLLDLGAAPHSPVQEVGDDIRVATVADPFGNIFGIIENPHFTPSSPRTGR